MRGFVLYFAGFPELAGFEGAFELRDVPALGRRGRRGSHRGRVLVHHVPELASHLNVVVLRRVMVQAGQAVHDVDMLHIFSPEGVKIAFF